MDIKLETEVVATREQREKEARTKINNLRNAAVQVFKEAGDLQSFSGPMHALFTEAFNLGVTFEQENRGEVHNPVVTPIPPNGSPKSPDVTSKAKAKEALTNL